MFSDNVVDDEDENGYADDAIIVVYDANGDPVENARVKIDGEHSGNTSDQGGTRSFTSLGSRGTNYQAEDISAGWHTITVEYDEVEPFTGETNTISSTRVIKSEGNGEDYIYANAFVTDGDNDGNKNDAKIVVSDNYGSPVSDATITLNSETFTSDSNGMITIHNIAEGRHQGEVESTGLTCTFSFESMGDGGGNEPPSAEFTIPEDDLQAGKELTFSAEAEDPDGDRVVYIWDFDDGSAEVVGDTVVHTFEDGGKYKVTLTVSDGIERISYSERITIGDSEDSGDGGIINGPIMNNILILVVVVIIIIVLVIVGLVKRKRNRKGKDKPEAASDDDESDDTKDDKVKMALGIYEKPIKGKTSAPVTKVATVKEDKKKPTDETKVKMESPKKYDAYQAALEQAWDDGIITEGEETLLKMLRSKYKISDDEHKMIETQIKLEKEL